MNDEDELDPTQAARADALLAALAGGPTAPFGPSWLDAASGWIAVGVLEGAAEPPEALRMHFTELESAGAGRWLLAVELEAPGGRPAADELRPLVDALRATDPTRAVLLVAEGALGAQSVLGDGPDEAADLYRGIRDAGGRGVYLDERTHSLVGGLASPEHGGLKLHDRTPARRPAARARWVGWAALAAGLALGVFGLSRTLEAPGPDARIYLVGESARVERGAQPDAWREHDLLTLTIEGAAGTYGTLVLLDSSDRLVLPSATLVNTPFEADRERASDRFELDDQPGLERFIAVVSAEPLDDIQAALDEANAEAEVGRARRIERLRAALEARVGDGFDLAETADLHHVE